MQNTKTEYSSSERTPVVLPEMEQLLPPLSGEQFSSLESDILENGCYAPIIVNGDMVVIDGHNRFRVCEKHGLPYRMLVFSFTDLLEAKQWALDTQKGRRNLDKWALGQIDPGVYCLLQFQPPPAPFGHPYAHGGLRPMPRGLTDACAVRQCTTAGGILCGFFVIFCFISLSA